MNDDSRSKPALRLLEILPRWLVIGIACFSFLSIGGLFLWALLDDGRFLIQPARMLLCLALAVYLSLFFFVLYPQKIMLRWVPGINVPVMIAGPPALFIVLVVFILQFFPDTPPGRVCLLHVESGSLPRVGTFGVVTADTDYDLIVSSEDPGIVRGIYVRFPDGSRNLKVKLRVGPGPAGTIEREIGRRLEPLSIKIGGVTE